MGRPFLNVAVFSTGPLRGSHDADVAHGENECDTPALAQSEHIIRGGLTELSAAIRGRQVF